MSEINFNLNKYTPEIIEEAKRRSMQILGEEFMLDIFITNKKVQLCGSRKYIIKREGKEYNVVLYCNQRKECAECKKRYAEKLLSNAGKENNFVTTLEKDNEYQRAKIRREMNGEVIFVPTKSGTQLITKKPINDNSVQVDDEAILSLAHSVPKGKRVSGNINKPKEVKKEELVINDDNLPTGVTTIETYRYDLYVTQAHNPKIVQNMIEFAVEIVGNWCDQQSINKRQKLVQKMLTMENITHKWVKTNTKKVKVRNVASESPTLIT